MQKIGKEEVHHCAKIFASAFYHDPLLKYFFPKPKKRLKKLYFLYKHLINNHFEQVHINNTKGECVLLIESPQELQKTALTFKDIYRGFILLYRVGVVDLWRMIRYQSWSSKIRKESIGDQYWYVMLIATKPAHQGKGYGAALMRKALEKTLETREKIYLQTHNPKNISFYEKFGFSVLKKVHIPKTEIHHYMMIKE